MISVKQIGILLVAIMVTVVTGCTSVSRGMGSLTDNKYAEPRSGTVWVVPPPQLEPPGSDERTVYISYRNISDADIDLRDLIVDTARNQGWTIVRDPQQAHYRLRSSVRYFGEVEPESGGAGVGQALGGIAGAAVGIGVGVGVANATDSGLAGVAAGLGIGGLVGAGLTNSSRPREWALIMDVVLEEQVAEPVTFEMNTGKNSGTADVAGASNSRMVSAGGTTQSNSSNATGTKTSDYFPHGIRLSVWANQMNMKEDEAIPHIVERTERVVTQMLPR